MNQRIQRAREEARRANAQLPPEAELRKQVVDTLIDERALLTYARDAGYRIDEAELERAVANVAAQNQLTPAQLRERLKSEGLEYSRFRANVRDQLMVERVREREVTTRVKVSDADVDAFVEQQRKDKPDAGEQLNIAQILVAVPDGADEAVLAARRARAQQVLARLRTGEDFAKVAAEVSQDAQREKGGEIGLRPASRLPDLFVDAVRALKPGELTGPVQSGAGFHILKLLESSDGSGFSVTQTRARHILLRPSAQLSPETAARRLETMRRQAEAGQRSFEALARENSEDGSAMSGGDLGWMSPGALVPEFEEAMNRLAPGAISAPVASRFGIHLIQVVERRNVTLDIKQVREQARAALREQKFEQAYNDWVRELRTRAYVEMREPPT